MATPDALIKLAAELKAFVRAGESSGLDTCLSQPRIQELNALLWPDIFEAAHDIQVEETREACLVLLCAKVDRCIRRMVIWKVSDNAIYTAQQNGVPRKAAMYRVALDMLSRDPELLRERRESEIVKRPLLHEIVAYRASNFFVPVLSRMKQTVEGSRLRSAAEVENEKKKAAFPFAVEEQDEVMVQALLQNFELDFPDELVDYIIGHKAPAPAPAPEWCKRIISIVIKERPQSITKDNILQALGRETTRSWRSYSRPRSTPPDSYTRPLRKAYRLPLTPASP